MNDYAKTQLKLFAAEALVQITGNEELVYRLLNLDTRQRFILRERKKMTTFLWLSVCRRFDWRCLRCGVRNVGNREWGKPKIQVDHVVALYNGGRTTFANLQTLCAPCNRQKGVRTADYRR